MPQEQPTVQDPTQRAAERAQEDVAYEPLPQPDEWADDTLELPRRPRRRLLAPVPLTLTAILLIACGFIGGVLVEKGQHSSSTGGSGSGLASRFAALRGSSSSTVGARAGGAAAGLFGGSGGGRPTAGQVAYLDGSTLYVTNSEGNTIKVKTSAGTTVTKTVSATVKGIHPGETVTVTGAAGSGGTISAESISVGSSGSGLAALFGGASSSGRSAGGSPSSSSSGPALFGG
jgi:hypothetical protein